MYKNRNEKMLVFVHVKLRFLYIYSLTFAETNNIAINVEFENEIKNIPLAINNIQGLMIDL